MLDNGRVGDEDGAHVVLSSPRLLLAVSVVELDGSPRSFRSSLSAAGRTLKVGYPVRTILIAST
ncbi:hypothetical protein SCP_1503410 [Sparassis crispa]|uniref:Uncharacterized protein n=1 Tax=Sparassis crispa TaxID=139825 RepID=A0A401H4K1_9APHY|nr:hypothetical protein SCP_1503410 [Sparassis crispa]GBE89333.1 hypothetical protein SCP_1503410 [Sparassis crispa]